MNKVKILILILILSFPFLAKAIRVSNVQDMISDSRQSVSGVKHTINWTGSVNNLECVKISFCTTANGACTVPAGFTSTAAVKGIFSGLTESNWSLDSTSNGTLKLTNLGGENPLANVSLEFLNTVNPSNSGGYYSRIATYSDDVCLSQVDYGWGSFTIIGQGINVTITIPGPTPTPTPPSGGGGGGGIIPFPQPGPAKVIFKGMAYPGAHITILKNTKVAGTAVALNTGDFEYTITGLASGSWNFGFFAEDIEGRKSVTVSFSTNILGGADTTISGIFISPTISLSGAAVKKGGNIDIFGQAYPGSDVNIFVASPVVYNEKTTAAKNGKWQYAFDTDVLEFGNHSARAKAITLTGDQSPFSEEMVFKVIEGCNGSDLNFDNKIDLIDFSILLYFWNQTSPANICSDINGNGTADLTDFSIMMYWWNG